MKKFLFIIFKQAPETYIGVVLVAIFASVCTDTLVKPGLSKFGRICLDLFSFGSLRVKDYVYEAASLDPTPVAPLVLLIILLSLSIAMIFYPSIRRLARKRVKNVVEETLRKVIPDSENEEQIERVVVEQLDAFASSNGKIFYFVYVLLILVMLFAYFLHNQSVIICDLYD